ncbi:TerB family tellurite resistance protein [Nereida sp. MMG025]|uniref:TerB family tellurite resistance protein n=1 Tax=Nereida sp. MMG025 TaxID=2909981 RepID=UPI001F460897|nr:TerB family tellurite resistance protein [Nereida sp. MMG025]MCF6445578.1 TerB family tellurite resistance protein [Nereida sp. MMG025]
MDSALAQRQLTSLDGIEAVVREPLKFKAQLGIGSDAYTSMWLGKRLQTMWDVGGVAATGAGFAQSATVASTFFAPTGWLSLVGLGGSAVTPVGWVAGAAVVSAGAYYGITRLLKDYGASRVVEIPTYINTPLDTLAISLFDFIATLALKVSYADGDFSDNEKEELVAFFVQDWGMDQDYVEIALDILRANQTTKRIDQAAHALKEFKAKNPDCNAEHIQKTVVKFLYDIASADGTVDETEEMVIARIRATMKGKSGFEKWLPSVTTVFARSNRH